MIPKELRDEFYVFFRENWPICIVIAACTIIALISLLYLPKDNPFEQVAEKIIEKKTGVELDFTP